MLTALPLGATTFKDNDAVVFLGNTVIERAQNYGYVETSVTLASGKKNLKFLSLGDDRLKSWGSRGSFHICC